MINKIVSGGQTGVDQAALDVAIELGIPHGGWLPRGRKTEKGPLPEKYKLKEMPTDRYSERTEQNVIDSDGTLIVSHGYLTGGSALTRHLAEKHERPWLHIDLSRKAAFEAARTITSWIARHEIRVLNVAGPRASEDPEIYEATSKLLRTVFHMEVIAVNMRDPSRTAPYLPRTVDEAVERLVSELSPKDRTTIGNMKEEGLHMLLPSLGRYIVERFGLSGGNRDLLKSCRYIAKKYDIDEDETAALIINELWKKLRTTHVLRVVK